VKEEEDVGVQRPLHVFILSTILDSLEQPMTSYNERRREEKEEEKKRRRQRGEEG